MAADNIGSVSTEVLYNHLKQAAVEIADLERSAAGRRIERDGVIRELLRRGETERQVGEAARISGPAIHNIKQKENHNG